MSYFRNLNKVVSSQLFSHPNNFILTSCHRPVYLETVEQPTIEYIHSAKALFSTIQQLQNLQNGQYSKLAYKQLDFLNSQRGSYSVKVKEFVHRGGLMTGEGIGNIYYVADRLELSEEWLEKYVHHFVPSKCGYMTRDNLVDTLAGLKKYHRNSPYIAVVEEELGKRAQESPKYVNIQRNETVKFEQGSGCSSNHPLVGVGKDSLASWKYYVWKAANHFLHKGRYLLHSE